MDNYNLVGFGSSRRGFSSARYISDRFDRFKTVMPETMKPHASVAPAMVKARGRMFVAATRPATKLAIQQIAASGRLPYRNMLAARRPLVKLLNRL